MKKMLAVFTFLALSLLLVGEAYAQGTTQFNRAWLVYSKTAYEDSTANDTTKFLNLSEMTAGRRSAPFDISCYGRSNDSIRVLVYYQLGNTEANHLGAWTALDSVIHVDDAGAATDTTTDGVNHNALASTTIKGADKVRFYFNYLGADAGIKTPAESGTDGTATLFRFYVVIRELYFR